jgi:hypothetical protein
MIMKGMAFEVKSIYGLHFNSLKSGSENEELHDLIGLPSDEKDVSEMGKECVVCLSEYSNTLIMPCSHFCVC